MPYKDPQKRREWWSRNKERVAAKRKETYRANRRHFIEQAKRGRLKMVYGFDRGEFDRILAEQGGVCAICRLPPRGGSHVANSLHVDHDHGTGRVRALLCNSCNHGIGHFRDNADLCRAAANYLERHGAKPKHREGSRVGQDEYPLFDLPKETNNAREA